jgi:Uma2 family endonuclease
MTSSPVRAKRWTRLEYERLVCLGAFGPEDHIELVAGNLLVREPQDSPHTTALGLTEDALRTAFGAGWHVRVQSPIALDDESEPEPDLAVVSGSRRDYAAAHPTQPVLLVEVADSSLSFDRRRKGSLYARARVPEYWIVNLVERVLEVHRNPQPAAGAVFGWRYTQIRRLSPDETVTPLGAPEARILVADLLP